MFVEPCSHWPWSQNVHLRSSEGATQPHYGQRSGLFVALHSVGQRSQPPPAAPHCEGESGVIIPCRHPLSSPTTISWTPWMHFAQVAPSFELHRPFLLQSLQFSSPVDEFRVGSLASPPISVAATSILHLHAATPLIQFSEYHSALLVGQWGSGVDYGMKCCTCCCWFATPKSESGLHHKMRTMLARWAPSHSILLLALSDYCCLCITIEVVQIGFLQFLSNPNLLGVGCG